MIDLFLRAPLAHSICWMIFLTASACCPYEGQKFTPNPRSRCGLPANATQLIQLADKLLSSGHSDKAQIYRALEALRKALRFEQGFEVHWRLARACFLLANRIDNRMQRLTYARHGLAHAYQARKANNSRVEAPYYEALNLGLIAETRADLKLVKPMMQAVKKAASIDERYDNAGPLVFMGKVYITAPAWPMSVGNTEKAVEVLERAVQIAPVPLNRIFLGQAYYQDEQYVRAEYQLKQALSQSSSHNLEARWRKEAVEFLGRIATERGGSDP